MSAAGCVPMSASAVPVSSPCSVLGAVVSGGKMVLCAGACVSFVIRINFSLQVVQAAYHAPQRIYLALPGLALFVLLRLPQNKGER